MICSTSLRDPTSLPECIYRSGIEIRDRYHSPYKEIIEAQYTEEDIRLYNINITYKTIIKGEEARKCASRWKREVLNET